MHCRPGSSNPPPRRSRWGKRAAAAPPVAPPLLTSAYTSHVLTTHLLHTHGPHGELAALAPACAPRAAYLPGFTGGDMNICIALWFLLLLPLVTVGPEASGTRHACRHDDAVCVRASHEVCPAPPCVASAVCTPLVPAGVPSILVLTASATHTHLVPRLPSRRAASRARRSPPARQDRGRQPTSSEHNAFESRCEYTRH